MTERSTRIEVSRRIPAPASLIFEILANPQRHMDFDGSGMLRGALSDRLLSATGDIFGMKMHRLGEDYLMLNYVVEFAQDRRIFWKPAPGDISRAQNGDPANIGVPAGYCWGYILVSESDNSTNVTEVFDSGSVTDSLLHEGGAWINGSNTLQESMNASLAKLEKIICGEQM